MLIQCFIGEIASGWARRRMSLPWRRQSFNCSSCTLMSSSSFYTQQTQHTMSVQLSAGRRAFSVAGLTTWNSLPKQLRDPVHTTSVFACLLKTFLFLSTSVYSALAAVFFSALMHYINWCFTYLLTYLLTPCQSHLVPLPVTPCLTLVHQCHQNVTSFMLT